MISKPWNIFENVALFFYIQVDKVLHRELWSQIPLKLQKLCTTQTNAHGKDKYDVTWIIRAPCKEGQALLRDIKKPSIITKCNLQLKATKVCSTHMYYSCVLFETIKLCTTWIYTLGENNDEVTFVIRASCKARLHMDISIWHHLSHMTPNLNI